MFSGRSVFCLQESCVPLSAAAPREVSAVAFCPPKLRLFAFVDTVYVTSALL